MLLEILELKAQDFLESFEYKFFIPKVTTFYKLLESVNSSKFNFFNRRYFLSVIFNTTPQNLHKILHVNHIY